MEYGELYYWVLSGSAGFCMCMFAMLVIGKSKLEKPWYVPILLLACCIAGYVGLVFGCVMVVNELWIKFFGRDLGLLED